MAFEHRPWVQRDELESWAFEAFHFGLVLVHWYHPGLACDRVGIASTVDLDGMD